MENIEHILQGTFISRQTRLRQNQEELHAGMMLLGYEVFDIGYESEDPRIERVISYRNDEKVLVFYITSYVTIGLKIFNMTKGLSQATTYFPSISVADARTIISKML